MPPNSEPRFPHNPVSFHAHVRIEKIVDILKLRNYRIDIRDLPVIRNLIAGEKKNRQFNRKTIKLQ